MKKTILLNSLAVCIAMVVAGQAYAVGQHTVVAGTVSDPVVAGNTTTIKQNSANAVINWDNFNIANGEKVEFNQPAADSAVLNRVLNASQTTIDGILAANGRVFVVNPSGVVFGQNAQVDVGALVASTLDISNNDFMSSPMSLGFINRESNAFVINKGMIKAGEFVHLQGGNVTNSGTIVSPSVTLASREKNTSIVVDRMARPANLRYRVAPSVNKLVNTGTIRATGIENKGGVIRLTGQNIEQNGELVANNLIYMQANDISTGIESKTSAPEVELKSVNTTLKGDITGAHVILASSIKVDQKSGSIKTDRLELGGKGAYSLTSEPNEIRNVIAGNKVKSLDFVSGRYSSKIYGIDAEEFVKAKTKHYLYAGGITTRDISLTSTDRGITLNGDVEATEQLNLSAKSDIKSYGAENVISASKVGIKSGQSVNINTLEMTNAPGIYSGGSISADKIHFSKLYSHSTKRLNVAADNGIVLDHYPLNIWLTHKGNITTGTPLIGLDRPPVAGGLGNSTWIRPHGEIDPGFTIPEDESMDGIMPY